MVTFVQIKKGSTVRSKEKEREREGGREKEGEDVGRRGREGRREDGWRGNEQREEKP